MTVIVNKKSSAKQIESAKRKILRQKKKKQGIARYFGALKRGIDGLVYQKTVRNEWH